MTAFIDSQKFRVVIVIRRTIST